MSSSMSGSATGPTGASLTHASATGSGAIEIVWLSTRDAARRLGITNRTLYRFIDEGQLPAYRFGRVIRLRLNEIDDFIEKSRIEPGTLEHLYPEPTTASPKA